MAQLIRLFQIYLVTTSIAHIAIANLSSSIDADLFLEDEGSGGGYWRWDGYGNYNYDSERHSTGIGPDDDDSNDHDSYFGGNSNRAGGGGLSDSFDLSPPVNNVDEGVNSHDLDTHSSDAHDRSSDLYPSSENSSPNNNNDIRGFNLFEDDDKLFDKKPENSASFFSQPGILAAIICGAIVGLLCAILLVMFVVYRMRKKDEGSYVLDTSKRVATSHGKSKEFYA